MCRTGLLTGKVDTGNRYGGITPLLDSELHRRQEAVGSGPTLVLVVNQPHSTGHLDRSPAGREASDGCTKRSNPDLWGEVEKKQSSSSRRSLTVFKA